jgi:hypothetical protein
VQLKFIVKQNLTDQYIQNWFNQIENSSRGEFYGIFKNEFNLEKNLLKLLPHDIMLYKIQLSFFWFEISLFQKFTILSFIHIYIGVLPSFPYVIKFGVVVLTPREFAKRRLLFISRCHI